MAEDWAIDVKKYVPDADDKVIAKIVSYCGIALRKRDSSLVSFSDPKETGRVRDGYCRKKLGLTESDAEVDAAIAAVGKRMSGDTTRNRVTVYYLLAEAYGKLGLFGGSSAAAAAVPVAAAGVSAAALMAAAPAAAAPAAAAPAAPVAAAPPAAAAPALAAAPATDHDVSHLHAAPAANGQWNGYGGLAAKVLGGFAVIVFGGALLGNLIGGGLDPQLDQPELPAYQGAPATAPAAAAAAAVIIPAGSGVIAETVQGMPKVSVYFDTGKTAIAPDFATVAGPVKAWIDANPGDRLAVSGFNDPTGNAAANAELSKNRAKAVAAALAGIGVAADRIDLEKPPETTATDADMSQARRVEIVVKTGG
jgi:outer membrane protein OmpA-like peptidoglycan-associated protein